jgi:hypothetical protein
MVRLHGSAHRGEQILLARSRRASERPSQLFPIHAPHHAPESPLPEF